LGYRFEQASMNELFKRLSKDCILYAPIRFAGGGRFSDTDIIRYGEVGGPSQIVFEEKSEMSFKEVLFPIMETLFAFTEDKIEANNPPQRDAIVFLRNCELNAVRRLDDIYLRNGMPDGFYKRNRARIHFAVMGCSDAFDSCFCVDMGANKAEGYDFSVDKRGEEYYLSCASESLTSLFASLAEEELPVEPDIVSETPTRVSIPDKLTKAVRASAIWDEYDKRCIACGRCNFACPTCTCFTMQDMFYSENKASGERRRVWASCMVDGFTDVAGGGAYRKKNGERMRFKVLHKVLDFKERFGEHMCVGCGRCDDVCPEYISFSHILNRLGEAMEEVSANASAK